MSDLKPYIVARWIAHEIREVSFVALNVVIENTLRAHLKSKSEEQIADLVERLDLEVFQQLGIVADQLIRSGTEPSFILEGEPGTSYIKAHNLEAMSVLTTLKSISPDDFEHFCAGVLGALGATARRVGHSGDGGIDFIATDVPVSAFTLTALSVCRPVVIGQAKRYSDDLISVTQLREFLGAALIRADELKRTDIRFGLFSPTIFAYWTTSDFNTAAREFAIKAGIWCLGGLPLAQLAIHLGLY